jgi:hypothetical protein
MRQAVLHKEMNLSPSRSGGVPARGGEALTLPDREDAQAGAGW